MFTEWTIKKHSMIVTADNYHINIICIKLNDLKILYFSETLLWSLQTFLTPILSVRNVSLTAECFFNFCFRSVSNNRTNPQSDSYFKAWHFPVRSLRHTLHAGLQPLWNEGKNGIYLMVFPKQYIHVTT